jgi:hypothetical protein
MIRVAPKREARESHKKCNDWLVLHRETGEEKDPPHDRSGCTEWHEIALSTLAVVVAASIEW